jgi:O-antigen/teichoic acid export membrane protein
MINGFRRVLTFQTRPCLPPAAYPLASNTARTDPSGAQLRQKTIDGIAWTTVTELVRSGSLFAFGIILARLLSPADFGLIGMITVFTAFADIYADLGFGSALVQSQDVTPEHYSTVFWLNAGMGLTLTLLFSALAPLVSRFYGLQILTPLCMIVSANFLIRSFGVVPSSIFKKRIDFRSLAQIEISAILGSGSVAILMALRGFGVWSLAFSSVVGTLVTTVLLSVLSHWRPRRQFSWIAAQQLWPFSRNLLGFTTVNYWLRNVDNLVVGRFLGAGPLGLYSKAYNLMVLPLGMVSGNVGSVLFPAFSTIKDDRERVASIYLRVIGVISLITFPMMIGLWILVDHFVIGILGNQWSGMIPLLKVFCFVGMIQSIATVNGSIYLSQGRSDLQFKVGTVIAILGAIAIVVGLRWGVQGVANAYATFVFLVTLPGIHIAVSLVGLSILRVVRNVSGVLVCSLAMGATLWFQGHLLPQSWPHWAYLATQVPSGILVYLTLNQVFQIQAYRDVKHLLMERLGAVSRSPVQAM